MKNIVLTSSFTDIADELKLKKLNNFEPNSVVAFISTAASVEKVTFYVKKAKKWFVENAFQVKEIDVVNSTADSLKLQLNECDIIYVSGGNTFYLMQELKKKDGDVTIKNMIEEGTLYIGESAGSMILSPSIEYVKLMDNPELAETLVDYTGLNSIDFYVVPHYNNMPFKGAVNKIIRNYGDILTLKPISNNEAIVIKDSSLEKIIVN